MTLKSLFFATLLATTLPVFAEKKVVQPKEFPAGRPFSPGILVDGTLYIAGQIGADLKTAKVPENFDAEVRQCLDNIGIILKEAGLTSPYLRAFVVGRINPLRFIKGDPPSLDELMATMTKRAAGMDAGKIKSSDVAASGGVPDDE